MRNRINRMKTYRMQEQASSAKLVFIGLRLVSVKMLNRYIRLQNDWEEQE